MFTEHHRGAQAGTIMDAATIAAVFHIATDFLAWPPATAMRSTADEIRHAVAEADRRGLAE